MNTTEAIISGHDTGRVTNLLWWLPKSQMTNHVLLPLRIGQLKKAGGWEAPMQRIAQSETTTRKQRQAHVQAGHFQLPHPRLGLEHWSPLIWLPPNLCNRDDTQTDDESHETSKLNMTLLANVATSSIDLKNIRKLTFFHKCPNVDLGYHLVWMSDFVRQLTTLYTGEQVSQWYKRIWEITPADLGQYFIIQSVVG